MTVSTVCSRCGAAYERRQHPRCTCGEPLWYDSDAAGFDWDDCTDDEGLWRYAPLLPASDPGGLAVVAGGTPLVRSRRLDDTAGCRVWVKDETEQPTGSYKDRGSAVALSLADADGTAPVGTVSYGNMAMSTAAHAASAGRDCVVLVPAETSSVRLELIAQYDPTVLRVEGDYGALYDDVLALDPETPVDFVLSDPPARTSGYKTVVFELFEQFASDVPDALALPASSGGFVSGVYQGLSDLEAAGLLDELPRLYAVQTAASDPITRAFERGSDDVMPLEPAAVGDTIAHSIGNPAPPSGNVVLDAVRETDGAVLSVTDEEITSAQRAFARRGGFCVEPASATPLAGVTRLVDRGEIGSDDDVVLLPTGTGFKEAGTGPGVDRSTFRVVDRADVPDRLHSLAADD